TGIMSVTDGVADVAATLAERVEADATNLRTALELTTATTAEMEAGAEADLRSMSPALVKSAIEALAPDPVLPNFGDIVTMDAADFVAHDDASVTNARPASDVSAWAKSATKPTYTYVEVGADPAGAAAARNPLIPVVLTDEGDCMAGAVAVSFSGAIYLSHTAGRPQYGITSGTLTHAVYWTGTQWKAWHIPSDKIWLSSTDAATPDLAEDWSPSSGASGSPAISVSWDFKTHSEAFQPASAGLTSPQNAGIASIRALGTGATDAAAGDDSRLGNERVPTAAGLTSKFSTNKATIVDGDRVGIFDSEASPTANIPKHTLWSLVKSTLKTYFDGLYALTGHNHTGTYQTPQTTLAGYGITDAATSAQGGKADTALQNLNGALLATGATVGATSQAQEFTQGISTPEWAMPERLGEEMVVNGNFATQTDWTLPAGWSWVDGKPKYTSGVLALAPAVALVPIIGAVYRVAVTFAEYLGGETAAYAITFGGSTNGSPIYSDDPRVYYLLAITATSLAITIGNGGASVKVVNVSIKRVFPAISRTPETSPLISASGIEINAVSSNFASGARLLVCRVDGAQVFGVTSPGTLSVGLTTTAATIFNMCGTTQLRAYPSTPLYLANPLGVSIGVVGTCSTLISDANAILALRQATDAMAFRVYGTFSARGISTTNLEAIEIKGVASNPFIIQSLKGSAGGTARDIEIRHGATDTNGVITPGTLVATFAAAGVTIPGTLGVTGVTTTGAANGFTHTDTATSIPVVGLNLTNASASSGSPNPTRCGGAIKMGGTAWKSTATAASQANSCQLEYLPITGAATTSGQFNIRNSTVSGVGNSTILFYCKSGGEVGVPGTLGVTGAATVTGLLTVNGGIAGTSQALSGNGAVAAVSVATLATTIVNTGTANTTTTLAAGSDGQIKTICFITDGGFDAVVTVTNPAWGGSGTITMNDANDLVMLQYLGAKWQVLSNSGCTLG
ncbi:MAG: hypothetical protein WCS43_11415, partial [Verrucomicrobiota bacterium]